MKNVFLCLINKGKSAAKYFIFSTLFMLLGVLGVNSVEAGTINDYSPNTQNITGANAVTSINGTLKNECVSPAADGELAYSITSASYKGNGNSTDCIAYVESGNEAKQYFYLQANPDQINTITFTVNVSSLHSDIAVFETGHSMGDPDYKDYDAYTLNDAKDGYDRVRITAAGADTDDMAGEVSISGSVGNHTLTFTYVLRNDDFGKHNISVFFYNGVHELENPLEYTTLKYTLSKPISEYTFGFSITAGATACTPELGKICVLYTPNPNTGSTNAGTITNDFTLKMTKEAAIYFSTVNTHEVIDADNPATEDDVLLYNTIYATNVFYNDGEKNQSGKEIVYKYYNLKDATKYSVGVSAKEESGEQYKFTLTVDASGVYNFTLQDIFGNTVTSSNTTEITDLSNRELSIFFIAYGADGETVLKSGKTGVDSYELAADLAKLTANNVKIGLELYFKIEIKNIYGVEGTGSRVILMNPLYHYTEDETLPEGVSPRSQISTTLTNTHYCRLAAYDSSDCVAAAGSSKFTQHDLFTTQTIDARDDEGIKAVSNNFTYMQGVVEDPESISSIKRNNRVNVDVNENGIFFVRVQDVYGNYVTNQIEISIIDQLRPVITLNATSSTTTNQSIDNYICSSMYVIGAGGTIQGYPEGLMSAENCNGNSVTYDHFEVVDPTNGTVKGESTTVLIDRSDYPGAATGNATVTGGYYNRGSTYEAIYQTQFNYADAIRMALLKVTDSVSTYNGSGATSTLTEKSIYETTNDTYTAYALYSVTPSTSAKADITTLLNRTNLGNDVIIRSNYIHYASEIEAHRTGQYVTFKVYVYDADGANSKNLLGPVDGLVCDSATDEADCNNIVNTYIDKAISFELEFTAKDYVGNVSNPITVKIDVIDDTTPGITKFDASTTEIQTDPTIVSNNINTECRLEIGSIIQKKSKLLECYGLLESGKYNFVDNATTYDFLSTSTYESSGYYKNILHAPLYGQILTSHASYDDSIKVYVCSMASPDDSHECYKDNNEDNGSWILITDEENLNVVFGNAGSYQIKFEIADNIKDYQNAHNVNKTTIIMCYYVNPRILLVRPLETSKEYGDVDTDIDYCVYATINTDAFYYNLFNITGGEYSDTYDFILKNYESRDYGRVYCTGQSSIETTGAKHVGLEDILVDEAELDGKLSRTYATGVNRLKLDLTVKDGHKPYEDAGYYYITMGELKIDEDHEQNYVLRIHPGYLLDGQIPNKVLKHYYDIVVDYNDQEVNGSQEGDQTEEISNVLYTIKQAKLDITANGGSKIYGNRDTNYKQAFNDEADNNISALTSINVASDGTKSTVNTNGVLSGYLNGFTVSGLKDGAVVKDLSRYTDIIKGYLRRETGEKVGIYYICNSDVGISNSIEHSDCSKINLSLNVADGNEIVDLAAGTNVYILKSDGSWQATTSGTAIAYGMYVKIGSSYYKLTRNNTDLTNKKFTDKNAALLWRYNYNDEDDAVKVVENTMNANQNYYIEYTANTYIINPSQVIVQPGFNQGKEYSNPAHVDPEYEIVVYGQYVDTNDNTKEIVSVVETNSFNGYTATIDKYGYPEAPTYGEYGDSELYFTDRRTKTSDVSGATFEYKFDDIALSNGEFSVDGVTYVYTEGTNKFCAKLDSSECYNNGDYVGMKKVTIQDNKAIITLVGVLTYQDYTLFTKDGTAGTGEISRETGEVVGWYKFVFDSTKLYAYAGDGNSYCEVSATKQYSVTTDGTSKCANYNVVYTDNAPTQNGTKYITTSVGDNYKHDGTHEGDSGHYSLAYPKTTKIILFSIFKRDIILSFNAFQETYGQVYGYFTTNAFAIPNVAAVPIRSDSTEIITCYRKDPNGKFVADNGNKYTALDYSQCGTDYGISSGDTWGSSGLNLQFTLNSVISTNFATNYPIPAGLYFVYATIGTEDANGNYVHENYNLVYIDYDILVAGDAEGNDEKHGAVEIVSKSVDLVGTYYQKEFGQAVYATYGENGTELTVNSNHIKGEAGAELTADTTIKIFDNNYYYCEKKEATTYNSVAGIIYGCAMKHATESNGDNYTYDHTNNVYLYTVNGMVSLQDNSGKVDEIYANFAGTPSRTRPDNKVTADIYGLLDDAGFYEISLADIIAVVAEYDGVTFAVDTGTIYRYTNYSINSKTSGGLYITPAQIEISVTENQTKMYGCAYNTINNGTISYSYENGYENCVETVEQYYDLGYEYTVTGDKANFLKDEAASSNDIFTSFNTACTTIASKENPSACNDISYSSLTYTVTPNYNETNHDKPSNTSLNTGNLFRIPADSEKTTYTFKDLYELSLESQKEPASAKFQNQTVGDYVITLGSLDTAFNNRKQCDGYSFASKVSDGSGTSWCKNFIVNYGGNNTSTHTSATKANNDNTFDSTAKDFELTNSDFLFTITKRNVVMTTEYNYKVVEDTEPDEGYTCKNLDDMFTYPSSTSWFGKTFDYAGRDYCSGGDDVFIKTGVTRFYAIDNSLAKAPWTGWTKSDSNTYVYYNDALYDVIASTSSIIREGEGGNTANRSDPVGKYAYIYRLTLNDLNSNNNNYVINYLVSNDNSSSSSATESTVGFAIDANASSLSKLDRWYTDDNHTCNSGTSCTQYDGTQTYEFIISGITYNNVNSYKTGTNISTLKPTVYFEIVRREIYIETQAVSKDYGIEDKYTMFNVRLCSDYTDSTCTEVARTNQWGVRTSLSKNDYDTFYPSNTFSQSAFKGSDQDSTYRGATTSSYAQAFGIYFYRTYGEEIGSYVIVACATQYENDLECRNQYENIADEDTRKTTVKSFVHNTPNNEYNASNYVVKTIPSTININTRKIHITPDEGQGFMYGNYETGKLIAPITFKEYYAPSHTPTETFGLVNGGIYFDSDDKITNQLALCIYDISERLTCINDRQNSSEGEVKGYVTTGLHEVSQTPQIHTSIGNIFKEIGFNVYNDDYTVDGDETRHALDRIVKDVTGAESQRYNRNVGTYEIKEGELSANNYCDEEGEVNCLNRNYVYDGFTQGIMYVITPATIEVTPKDDQEKIYGENDKHIDFTVQTTFTYREIDTSEHDTYYCELSSECQDIDSFSNKNDDKSAGNTIVLDGFAYEENDDTIDSYNYGVSRVSDKTNEPQKIESDFTDDSENNPKYYDKYCYGFDDVDDCNPYNNAANHSYVSITYRDTSRILLGYFYVKGWDQEAQKHPILNGIVVAENQFGLVNYTYEVALGDDTGKEFIINTLEITASISSVTKVYGQATDSHKCDSYNDVDNRYNCNTDYATLTAADNEGRLEYNFNVVNNNDEYEVGVNTLNDKVLLTTAVNGKYYTQTANPEYKNIHLGLTVVRAIDNNTTCISSEDKYGCEDAGEYTLVFRKQSVEKEVDSNYTILIDGKDISVPQNILANQTGYAIVDSTTIPIDETEGRENTSIEYIYYKNSNEIDTVINNSEKITIVNGGTSTLTINKRDIMFYVGTYNDDATPAQRFVIEQNEQVPEYPEINDYFTTSNASETRPVTSKQIYYVTWFDMVEYKIGESAPAANTYTYVPRQVRTSDNLRGADAYGVLLCKTKSSNIQSEVYGSGNCENTVSYADANSIEGTSYVFSTAEVGDYAMVRNKAATYIVSEANESKNYVTDDHNGTLVIYEDQTEPVIQIGNNTFVLEANADHVNIENKECTVVNTSGKSFSYDCDVAGKRFGENNKSLGEIIKYLTNKYSQYGRTPTDRNNKNESIIPMPTSLGETVPNGWIYQPVNNIGVTSANGSVTTLYSVDRTENTYDFDTSYINSDLQAISSIISWFNITSYDYSYVRTGFVSKRYTPRYYVYINGLSSPATGDPTTFDPTYVGDFTITIYAIDDVGNQAKSEVTLKIVDTTKPVTGELHVFNAPVQYKDVSEGSLAKTSDIDDWFVAPGRVSIDAFIKYKYTGSDYVEDNTNGTYIKLDGYYVNLYGNTIQRFMTADATTPNIFGKFVNVTLNKTKAVEVEHKYWSNNKTKYIVVVGGQDNSYIDVNNAIDTQSQWDTYFTINGSTWYRYNRHDLDGVAIDFADGTNTIWTRVLDKGRYFTSSTVGNGHTYYDEVFLRYFEDENVPGCQGLSDCAEVKDPDDPSVAHQPVSITQVQNVPMEKVDSNLYTFSIQSILVTLDVSEWNNEKVSWEGQSEVSVATENGVKTFEFGIMVCTIDDYYSLVNCNTEYKLVYRPSKDVSTVDEHTYSITNSANIGDWDVIPDDVISGFSKDRRYIFVDTAAPTLEMEGYRYSVYEYENSCQSDGSDAICKTSYDEYFLNASDNITSETSSTVTGTALGNNEAKDLTNTGYSGIAWYTGGEYKKEAPTSTRSGLLEDTTLIMSGTDTYTNSHDTGSTFNKHHLDLVVYLNAKNAGGESDDSRGRYIAIFNGSNYILFTQTRDGAQYEVIQSFSSGTPTAYDTIEGILEYIVSTASVTDTTGLKNMMTFSINYAVRDAANNVSEVKDSVAVRGVTYVKLSSAIAVNIPPAATPSNAGVSMVNNGNNVYTVTANQGVSLSNLVNSLSISNIDKDGVNNMGTVKQALYYNGEMLFEGVNFNEDVFDLIQDYASTPGTYTLRLTSTRQVNSVKNQGLTYTVEDTPLEINFVIKPAVASLNDTGDYSSNVIIIMSMMMATLFLMGLGYVALKRIKK